MQRKSTPSLRLKTTARQPGQAADGCRTARPGFSPDHDWRSRIVEGLVREQPCPAALGRSCRSTPRYRRRSWWLDTSPPAQSRRAVKRWHGHAQDLWRRNIQIAAWCALGSTQAHIGAKYGLTRQRVGQIVREFEWVQEAVQKRLQSLDENHGGEGGKCQSSFRGCGGSGSSDLECLGRCSGEFRPLSRANRTLWRRVCASRGPGDRRRHRRRACGGRLAVLALASLESAGGFPDPERGGEVPVQPDPERGESASFAGGDQPPLAASRRGCLAAARVRVPGPGAVPGAGIPADIPAPAGAFLVVDMVFQRRSRVRLLARVRWVLRWLGWPGIRARWAYATPARCARLTVLWIAEPTTSPYQ